MEPTSSSSLAFIKVLGAQPILAALSAILGFLVLKPKTVREGLARTVFTAIASIALGPLFVAAAHARWPALFESALALDTMQGSGLGILYVTAPLQILAGLPAWWIIGAFLRWFDRRQHKDLGEMFHDLKDMLPKKKEG